MPVDLPPPPAVRSPAAAPLTLTAALARALSAHPRVRASSLDVEAAKAREVQAAAWPNPSLALSIDQVPFMQPRAGNYMAGLIQPLPPPGLRDAQQAIARVERESAEVAHVLARREVASEVMTAYVQALDAAERLRLARDSAGHARWLAQAATRRWKAGDVAQVAVLRAEVEAGHAARAELEAEGAEAIALARLALRLGEPGRTTWRLAPLPAPRPGALPPLATLVARALATRADLKRAGLQVERETLGRQAAAAGIWTGTEVAASLGAVAGSPGFTTTLALPIPLYARQGEVAEAEAARLRAEAARESLRQEIALEVEEAWRGARLAADQAQRSATDWVPRAERLLANARKRFAAGEGTGVEVAEAQHALHEAWSERQQAAAAWRVALVALAHAVGTEAWEWGA